MHECVCVRACVCVESGAQDMASNLLCLDITYIIIILLLWLPVCYAGPYPVKGTIQRPCVCT